MLQKIKETTPLRNQPFKSEDFDFGEEQSSNIQILKNIDYVENGYYLIIAVHSDIDKRNEFVTKVLASGRTDVDFFYDVKTSKYYIYYDKFDTYKAISPWEKYTKLKVHGKQMDMYVDGQGQPIDYQNLDADFQGMQKPPDPTEVAISCILTEAESKGIEQIPSKNMQELVKNQGIDINPRVLPL